MLVDCNVEGDMPPVRQSGERPFPVFAKDALQQHQRDNSNNWRQKMRKFDPCPVFVLRECWPFLVGFAVTGNIITKFSLSLTEEDKKNSPFAQRHYKRQQDQRDNSNNWRQKMRKFDPWPVFFRREWNSNWPFLVDFAVTGTIITKFSLSLTEEDKKNSPFAQRHYKR